MVHLRMTGQLLLAEPGTLRPPHTHVVVHLAPLAPGTDGHELWFVDPRTFGEVVVFDPDHVAVEVPELANLGLDPIADEFDAAELHDLLRRRTTHLKPLLLDQHVVAGVGNIYADEILHAARLHPDLPGTLLRRADSQRLHDAMQRILHDAIRAGGSTLRDAQYVDLMGAGGSYQDDHLVYGRAGERCRTCGRGVVRRVVRAGRSTHFCPVCQRPRQVPTAAVPRGASPTRRGPTR
jgi:formamidopyrimidine-DNA glycosylase